MGNSLQDAIRAALQMKSGQHPQASENNEKSKPTTKDKSVQIIDTGKKHSLENKDRSFIETMQEEGIVSLRPGRRKIISRTILREKTSNHGKTTRYPQEQQPRKPRKRKISKTQQPLQKVKAEKPIRTGISKKSTTVKAPSIRKAKREIAVVPDPDKQVIQEPGFSIKVKNPISPNPVLVSIPELKKQSINTDGPEQIAGHQHADEREINIGLDFGTSSVKVVIGDKVLGKAYAVPFAKAIGLDAFLLPSRVWSDTESYSLEELDVPHRNLKLRLVEEECYSESFMSAAVFLAFVIRHARGWLLTAKAEIYAQTHIYWNLTLGIPAKDFENKIVNERFLKLGAAAWLLSRNEGQAIPKKVVRDVCRMVEQQHFNDLVLSSELEMIGFDAVPELSAQIYGFITSTKFDPKAANTFMIVDVGAGTVDSSIFHVKKGRVKKLTFTFFANCLEFNGVVNLHAARVSWLRKNVQDESVLSMLHNYLNQMDSPTDYMKSIPENINEYFHGINCKFTNHETSPDHIFFRHRLRRQIAENTLKRAKDFFVSNDEPKEMPWFLCGGGSRMRFFQQLEKELYSHQNASWFAFRPRKLEIPESLEAPGVVKQDFDRLSVAFGLSLVSIAELKEAERPVHKEPRRARSACQACGSSTICYCD